MSSTNRGAVRKAQDFYPTPESAFKPLIPHLPRIDWWEPACGDKRLIKWLMEAGHDARGDDLSNGYDFLKQKWMHEGIITNPPFSLAQEFVEHALNWSEDVVMLLRLNFLGSQKRCEWWKRHEPDALFILSERPDFTGGGGDSTEYAWFCWGHNFEDMDSKIQHLSPWKPTSSP